MSLLKYAMKSKGEDSAIWIEVVSSVGLAELSFRQSWLVKMLLTIQIQVLIQIQIKILIQIEIQITIEGMIINTI